MRGISADASVSWHRRPVRGASQSIGVAGTCCLGRVHDQICSARKAISAAGRQRPIRGASSIARSPSPPPNDRGRPLAADRRPTEPRLGGSRSAPHPAGRARCSSLAHGALGQASDDIDLANRFVDQGWHRTRPRSSAAADRPAANIAKKNSVVGDRRRAPRARVNAAIMSNAGHFC